MGEQGVETNTNVQRDDERVFQGRGVERALELFDDIPGCATTVTSRITSPWARACAAATGNAHSSSSTPWMKGWSETQSRQHSHGRRRGGGDDEFGAPAGRCREEEPKPDAKTKKDADDDDDDDDERDESDESDDDDLDSRRMALRLRFRRRARGVRTALVPNRRSRDCPPVASRRPPRRTRDARAPPEGGAAARREVRGEATCRKRRGTRGRGCREKTRRARAQAEGGEG